MKDTRKCTDPTWIATGCQGKERMTMEQAQKVANSMRNRPGRGAVSAYRCGACGCWHVGSSNKYRPPAKVINQPRRSHE